MTDKVEEQLGFLRDQATRLKEQHARHEEPWMDGWAALLRQAMAIVRQEAKGAR